MILAFVVPVADVSPLQLPEDFFAKALDAPQTDCLYSVL